MSITLKPKSKRIIYIVFCGFVLTIATFMILTALNNSILHFYSPSEISDFKTQKNKFRIGGLVVKNSIKTEELETNFKLTDGAQTITVSYVGLLPDLFREGQGIVAEGNFINKKFHAELILAKHDENYMPKEVADKLKNNGLWQGKIEK